MRVVDTRRGAVFVEKFAKLNKQYPQKILLLLTSKIAAPFWLGVKLKNKIVGPLRLSSNLKYLVTKYYCYFGSRLSYVYLENLVQIYKCALW